jgi:5'-3' exonuclease
VTEKDVLEEFYTTPDRIPLSKAFHGDPSDDVKGVHRLIKKNMAPYLFKNAEVTAAQEVEAVYYSVRRAVSESTGKDLVKATKLLVKIEPEYDRVCANFKVVTANTTGFTSEHFRAGLQDKEQLISALERMECKTLLERVDDFFGAEMYLQH